MLADQLSDHQIATARELWGRGRTLGEIAEALGCSIYHLSPWLYVENLRPAESRNEVS